MRRIWLLLLAVAAVAAHAQSAQDTFRNALEDKELYVRGFGADPVVHWHCDAGTLVMEPAKVHTLGLLKVQSVKIKPGRVEVRGALNTLLRDDTGALAVNDRPEPTMLQVDMAGCGDTDVMFAQLPAKLFYASADDAIANLPEDYRNILPAKADGSVCCGKNRKVAGTNDSSAKASLKACDCAAPSAPECGRKHTMMGMQGMKPPRVIHMVDAEFSEEARRKGVNANVRVGLTVNDAGRPEDLWIVSPAGFGLNAQSAAAVSSYVFAPATCHDKPVPVNLMVDVNYQIFKH